MTNLKIKFIDVWCLFAIKQLTIAELSNCINWFKDSTNIKSTSLQNRLAIQLIENGKL